MAAFTIRVTVNSGGLISLTNASGTDGESFGTPLEVNAGDTVTFDGFSIATGRSASVTALSIFTNNSTVNIANNSSSVTRTVASGGLTFNSLNGQSDFFENDFFFLERQAASIVAPVINNTTTNNAASQSVIVTVNLTSNGSGGTLEYAQNTTTSVPATGWQSSNQFTQDRNTTRYYFASQDQDTTGAFDGPETRAVGYFTGDPSAVASSFSPGTTTGSQGSFVHTISAGYAGDVAATITGGSANTRYRILNTTTGLGTGNTGDGNGTIQIGSVRDSDLPPINQTSASSHTYAVQYKVIPSNGGNDLWANVSPADTFTITRTGLGAVATPTGFAVTDATGSGQTYPNGTGTTNNLTADALSGHTLQFRVDSGTWSTTSSYSHTYGTERVYEARYVRTSDSAVSATPASITRKVADAIVTISPVTSILSTNSTNELKIADIGGATDRTQYRARATGNINGSSVTNLFINAPVATGANPDINAANPTELPAAGTSATYTIMARVRGQDNGDGAYRQLPPSVANRSWTLSRTDGTPNAYTIPDVTNAALGAEQNEFVQITGITETVTASRTSGTATFAISGSTTTPSAGSFSSTAKNITNNQYLHVKQDSSGTAGTPLNTVFSVGGVTDTFSNTTAGSGDVTVTIVYDNEFGSFVPAPGFTPFVSGQNGLSNVQAYEITAGTDVVFQNVSDPGSPDVTVSDLNSFTVNTSFTIAQGSSVTRTWATGVTGNSVDSILLTRGLDTELIYFKQPPVDPDLNVTPVSPANRAFNDTDTFNVTVNDVTSGETYKITENNFTTSLGSATASGTSVTIPMTIGNFESNNYGQLGVGETKTYEIHASRPANLGGTGSFVQTNDTFTVTRNTESVSVPTDIVFTDPGTNDDNVNITVTASGGSGGTLQVSDDNSNWDANGTAYAAVRNTQGTYYARRLGSQGASVSTVRPENFTPPYLAPDSNITVTGTAVNATITPGATGNLTATINNGGSLDEYQIVTTDTNTPLASGISVGSRTGSGNITISNGEQPDGQGTSAGYKVQVRRPTATGGNDTFADTGDTFTITRQAISAPTDIVFGADPGTNSATVSITVTASGGANGTIQLSETSNFSSTSANGSSFTFTRGSAKTIYARRVDGAVVSGTYSEANTVGYKTPDQAIAGTDDTIAFNANSATTTVSSVARSTDTVAVRLNNGSTNIATRDGNGDITFTSNLPTVGDTTTYEFFTRRAVSTGGDGSTFYATNDTFTVTRSVEPVGIPTDIVFSDPGTNDDNVNITCSASGGFGGTLQVSENNSTWVSNGTAFAFVRGTAKTIYARRQGSGSTTASYSESYTPPYRSPDSNITVTGTAVNATITPGATGNLTATINNGGSLDEYQIVTTDTNTPLASGDSVGSRTGSGNITISNGEQPDGQGTSAGYKVQVRRPTATGGNDTFADTGDTFTITRQAISAPTDIVFGADPGTNSATVSITVTASGGANGTIQLSETSNFSSTSANGSSFTFTRGSAKTIYARRVDGAVVSGTYSEANTVGYKTPDQAIAGTDDTIAFNSNSATTTVSSVARSTDTVAVRLNNGSTNIATRDGNGDITFTSNLPTVGNTTTYEFFTRRAVSTGGDGSTFYATNDTFTVTRSVEPVTAPTDIVFGADPGTRDDAVFISCSAVGGAGGNLEVSQDNTNWFNSPQNFTFIRGTPKTIYARRNGAGNQSTSYSESFTADYITPDTTVSLSIVSNSISPGATANITANVSGGTEGEVVQIRTDDTNTPLASGTSVGSATFNSSGNASITISSGEQPTLESTANTATYRCFVRNPEASGGDNGYDSTSATDTITRQIHTNPTDIVFGADPGTADEIASISCTAAGGTYGTLQVSENNSTWVSNGSSFNFTRGTAKTIYARRLDGSVASGSYSESFTLSYLTPDLAVSASDDTIAFNANSATTTVSSVARSTDTVAVRLNNGSTNIATRDGDGDITFTGSLPTVGNTTTYELFTRRAVSTGGDGSTFYATNDTFTVTRNVESVTAPTDLVFSDPGTNDDNVNITVTASGGSGGTLQVSDDNSTFVANGTAFAAIRGTQATYYARREGSGANSSSYPENYTPPYRTPDTNISATPATTTISPGSTSTVNVSITGMTAIDEYRLVTTDTNTPQVSGHEVDFGTGVTSDTFVIAANELPDVQGTSAGYKMQVRRPVAVGGDNGYDDTGDTFSISRQSISAPTDIVFSSDPGTASDTVSIPCTASGGANGTIQLSEVSNFASTVSNGSSFTFTRGAAKTIYSRRIDGSVSSDTYSEANTVGFLGSDLSVSAANVSITFDATGATVTVGNIARSTETVAIRTVNGGTNLATRNGNGNISLTSNLPTVGNTNTYELYTRRAVSTGGDGSTFSDTNDQFTITRNVEPVTSPTDIVFSDPSTPDDNITITVTGSGGSGGVIKVSDDNSTFVANGTSFSATRGTSVTYYARREGSGNSSSSYSEAYQPPYLSPDSSISSANITISGSSNTTATITVNGTTSGETIDIRPNSAPYTFVYASAVASSSTTVIPLTTNLPTQGNSTSYRLSATRPVAIGGDGLFDIGGSFTITRAADSAPSFTVTSNCAAAATVALTFNFSSVGSGGDGNLYYAVDATNGITPPPFGWTTTQPTSQSRNTTIKYWVSRVSNGQSLVSAFSLASGYIPADLDVGITPSTQDVQQGVASTTFNILNTTQHHLYRVFDLENDIEISNSSSGGTLVVTIPTVGFEEGQGIECFVQASLATNRGGDGVPRDINSSSSALIDIIPEGAAKLVPAQFYFTDVESASVGQTYTDRVQIVGVGPAPVTASLESGNATFAVSSTAKPEPSAASFTQANKSVTEGQFLFARQQASSNAFTTVTSVIKVGSREDDFRVTTGPLPAVNYGTEWYSDNTNSSFVVTSASSDIPTGKGSSVAVNCVTMLPGDTLAITVGNGPSSESANLYALFSEIGGRFENQFTDVKINVGSTYTATVADTFTGSVFLRLVSELNYDTNQLPVSKLVNSTGYIPIHMKMPVIPQNYGMRVYAPNGTLQAIDENTNVASLETDYATTVSIGAGASTTITNVDIGDQGLVDYIIPGGLNTESLSGTVAIDIASTSSSTIEITNTGDDPISNIPFQFIRIF